MRSASRRVRASSLRAPQRLSVRPWVSGLLHLWIDVHKKWCGGGEALRRTPQESEKPERMVEARCSASSCLYASLSTFGIVLFGVPASSASRLILLSKSESNEEIVSG